MKKYDPKTYDGGDRPDETPKSFWSKEWDDAFRRGGYWSATLNAWVPCREVSEEDFWASQPRGVRRRHGKLEQED